jgi:hypothetical protein
VSCRIWTIDFARSSSRAPSGVTSTPAADAQPACPKFGLKQHQADALLSSWLDNEVIVLDMVDSRSKHRGLRVLDWL